MKILFWGVVNFFVIGILVLLMLGGYVLYGILSVILGLRRAGAPVRFLVFGFSVLFVLGGGLGYRILAPLPGARQSIDIEVAKGANARQVGRVLREKGLIRNEAEFRMAASILSLDRDLKAGFYSILRGSSLYEVLKILSRGDLLLETVMIPEGLTIWDTAARLAKTCSVDSAGFVDLANDPVWLRELGIEGASVEGYLFPDTYRFARGTGLRTMMAAMVGRSLRVYDSLLQQSAFRGRYTRTQIITLASIVERESAVDEERPLIAGVFWNRITLGMPLGADPTVRYALRKFTAPLTVSDLNIASPYNTRRYRDLPPGPICSPGAKSLLAVLFPAQTRDLFFVAKDDGSRQHYFTSSLSDHVKAKNLAKTERGKRAECSVGKKVP